MNGNFRKESGRNISRANSGLNQKQAFLGNSEKGRKPRGKDLTRLLDKKKPFETPEMAQAALPGILAEQKALVEQVTQAQMKKVQKFIDSLQKNKLELPKYNLNNNRELKQLPPVMRRLALISVLLSFATAACSNTVEATINTENNAFETEIAPVAKRPEEAPTPDEVEEENNPESEGSTPEEGVIEAPTEEQLIEAVIEAGATQEAASAFAKDFEDNGSSSTFVENEAKNKITKVSATPEGIVRTTITTQELQGPLDERDENSPRITKLRVEEKTGRDVVIGSYYGEEVDVIGSAEINGAIVDLVAISIRKNGEKGEVRILDYELSGVREDGGDEDESPVDSYEESSLTKEQLLENKNSYPLNIVSELGTSTIDCIVVEIIYDKALKLSNGNPVPMSAKCEYLNVDDEIEETTISLIIRGPNDDANVSGLYYPEYTWDGQTPKTLLEAFEIGHWLTHQNEYDHPKTWRDGGDKPNFGPGDILSIGFMVDPNSKLYENPGIYEGVIKFFTEAGGSIYTQPSLEKFLTTGRQSDLVLTKKAIEDGWTSDIFWGGNVFNTLFWEDK